MKLFRDDQYLWSLILDEPEDSDVNIYYAEALPRYLTALDKAFVQALEVSEYDFILTLLRVRGIEEPGWDPYITTLESIPTLVEMATKSDNFESTRHLTLWIYGHILEASEPYEIIANLLSVSIGDEYCIRHFPAKKNGLPQTVGDKISKLKTLAGRAGLNDVLIPLDEIWNRTLRNSIFHADYSLFGEEVRTASPLKSFSNEDIIKLINRTLAYHFSLAYLFRFYISSYIEPTIVKSNTESSIDSGEAYGVIIREDYGVIGLRNILTEEQVQQGFIKVHIGRFYEDEKKLIHENPFLFKLPAKGRRDIYSMLS